LVGKLVHPGGMIEGLTWSPDNKWLAFSDNRQVYKVKVTGDSLFKITSTGNNYDPCWSKDGQWIAFSSDVPNDESSSGIWIIRSSYPPSGLQRIGLAGLPTWHPNGQIILGSRALSPSSIWTHFLVFHPFTNEAPETLNAVYGNQNYYPKYSPDGFDIAFQSLAPGGRFEVWVMSSDGRSPRQLTNNQGYDPAWSPDGQLIVYTDSRKDNGRLWIMRFDGSSKRQLTFP